MKQKLLLKTMLLLCALIAGSSSVWADDPIVLYSENFGTPSSNTNISSFTGWSATTAMFNLTGSETVASCYSGNKVGTGDASTTTDYAAASGEGNAFQQGSAKTQTTILTVQKIKITGKGSLSLNFAVRNGGAASYVDAYYQIDEGSETKLTLSGYGSTIGWHYVSASIPGTGTNLKLIFKQTPTKTWITRIDDIKLTGISTKTPTTTTINPTGITNTDVYTSTEAGSLSASVTVTAGGAAVGGATVTWTSSNPAVATIASDGTVTLVKKGSTTITATYAGDETYDGSTDTYDLIVTSSAPQNTDISVTTNYEWLGVEKTKNISADDLPKDIDCEGVTVTIGDGGSTKPRGDDNYIRVYAGNSFKFTAPDNYLIKEIAFTKANSAWANTFNVDAGTWDNENLKWTGYAKEVTLTEAGSSGNNQFSEMNIKLVQSKAVTIATSGLSSFCSESVLDLEHLPDGLTAYQVKTTSGTKVTMSEVTIPVATGTGLILEGTPGETYNIPVGSIGTTLDDNKLVGVTEVGGAAIGGDTKYDYIMKGGKFCRASAGTIAKGKAYLHLEAPAAGELSLDFDGEEDDETTGEEETTGIKAIDNSQLIVDNVYNLNGQRVSKPTKGLYIVNGRKVVIK